MRSEGQKESRKQEDRLAKVVGGKRVAASGAFWSRKGDVRSAELLIEAKWTGKKQFTLRHDVLKKVLLEATLAGRTPVLAVSFEGHDNYIILTEEDFMDLWTDAHGPLE